VPLHDLKVGVWCEISAGGITGHVFLMQQYMLGVIHMYEIDLQQTDDKKLYRYFMEDNATAHTAEDSSMH
jgi:hypothetical protein